jgi:8-oxo-dGTP diphosphatase
VSKRQVAGALLVSTRGTLLLQHRDNKPTIANPGKLSAFGGSIEGKETILEGVMREVYEETNLRPSREKFTFFKTYENEHGVNNEFEDHHYFILLDIDPDTLEIYEGQGFIEVEPKQIETYDFSDSTSRLVRDYCLTI